MLSPKTAVLVLAGGRAQRWQGQDKGLVWVRGRPMLAWLLESWSDLPLAWWAVVRPGAEAEYQCLGFACLRDKRLGQLGPLAGIEVGLAQVAAPWMLVLPCDMPFLPSAVFAAMWATAHADEAGPAQAVVLQADGVMHWTILLLHQSLLHSLSAYLDGGRAKVQDWVRAIPAKICAFSDPHSPQAFANINAHVDIPDPC